MFKGKVRNPVTVVLLSFITCGIYMIYWLFVVSGEINKAVGEERISAPLYFLLGLLCFPLIFVGMFKMDESIFDIRTRAGLPANKNFILWLVLSLIGIGSIIFLYQVQSQLNEVWEKS
ncbi:MAG: DUF4234 domain-containing protein [Saccharofermentanales bacterium]